MDTLIVFLNSKDSILINHHSIENIVNCCKCSNIKNPDGFNIITLLPILIPLVLVILSGLFALYQVKSNSISSARILWIENFRTNLSEYCSYTIKAIHKLSDMLAKSKIYKTADYPDLYKDYNEYISNHSESNKCKYKTKLYLNSVESKPKEIEDLLDSIEIDINNYFNDKDEKYYDIIEEWTKSKNILKIK